MRRIPHVGSILKVQDLPASPRLRFAAVGRGGCSGHDSITILCAMPTAQMSLDPGGRPTARAILDRIRTESRDEAEKGRWFEQSFMRIALQDPAFELDGIWRWPDWSKRRLRRRRLTVMSLAAG